MDLAEALAELNESHQEVEMETKRLAEVTDRKQAALAEFGAARARLAQARDRVADPAVPLNNIVEEGIPAADDLDVAANQLSVVLDEFVAAHDRLIAAHERLAAANERLVEALANQPVPPGQPGQPNARRRKAVSRRHRVNRRKTTRRRRNY